MASKNNVGRPLKFKTKEVLQERIDNYFLICDETERPYTITGLALHLDSSRETLLEYGQKDEFVDTIKRAKLKVHNYTEEKLYKSGIATGVIFNLKNNWGWSDKREQEIRLEEVKVSEEERKKVMDLISNVEEDEDDE